MSAPVEAIANARGRAAYNRNDELLDLIDKRWNTCLRPDFFTTVAFECEVDAALSWTLPTREATRITRAYHGDPTATDAMTQTAAWIRKREFGLQKWFGNGGR